MTRPQRARRACWEVLLGFLAGCLAAVVLAAIYVPLYHLIH